MGRTLYEIERDFGRSYTENLTINRTDTNPFITEVLHMIGNRSLSLSLRRHLFLA